MSMFNDKMIFPTTYCYLKDTICKAGNCMSKGLCEVCQYGLLRAYAARDSEHIGSLMKETEALVRANMEGML